MIAADRAAIEKRGGRRAGSLLRVYDAPKEHPIASLSGIGKRIKLAFATAASAMEALAAWGIAREITGRRRDRLFVYDRYLAILDEGTGTP